MGRDHQAAQHPGELTRGMDQARLQPLGLQRLRVLACLGGDMPGAPGYFAPAPGADVFAAFREHVAALSRRWAAGDDPSVAALLAAARLLCGDLTAAETILDHLPAAPIERDHGAGFCLVLPFHALATALPLPRVLAETRRWLAGSAEQAALRAWLAAHCDRLRWVEAEAVYVAERPEA